MQGICEKGKKIGEEEVTVDRGESVKGFLNAWFRKQEKGPLAAHVPKWEAQYRVEAVASQHEKALGTASPAKEQGRWQGGPRLQAGLRATWRSRCRGCPGTPCGPAGGGAAPPKTGLLDRVPEDEEDLAYA